MSWAHRCFLVRFRRLLWIRRLSLQESYRILELPGAQSAPQLKEAYLRLAKLYHPDSGAATADAALFAQLEEAYRTAMAHQNRTANQQKEEPEEEEGRSKRAALQHRHYLSYEGVGTMSQRERQHRQARVDRAAEQVLAYRQREGAGSEVGVRGPTQALDRLVEDLIQESMARGDFQNLSGAGKPLTKFQENPNADPAEHNLNRILLDNGYQPEWVAAQRQIRDDVARTRSRLLEARLLGEEQWERVSAEVQEELKSLNKQVDRYNLMAPTLAMQMPHFSFDREAKRAAGDAPRVRQEERQRRKEEKKKANRKQEPGSRSRKQNLVSWIHNLLRFPQK